MPLVVDTSAWVRQRDPAYVDRWKATVREDRIAVCPAVAIEILASARDDTEFLALDRALSALPQAPITATVTSAALAASRQLGGDRRRLPAIDYLVAAAAAERGFGVLHLGCHYDTLADVLGFESVRLDRA